MREREKDAMILNISPFFNIILPLPAPGTFLRKGLTMFLIGKKISSQFQTTTYISKERFELIGH